DGTDASEELDPANDLICFTCDKEFKTTAQKTNHEQSKKHQRAVREVRREMMREERQMAKSMAGANTATTVNTASDIDLIVVGDSDNSNDSGRPTSNVGNAKDDVLSQMLRDLTMAQAGKGKKGKKKRQRADKALDDTGESTSVAPTESLNGSEQGSTQASKRELRREKQKSKVAAGGGLACNVCDEDFASRNQLFKHITDTGHALAEHGSQQKNTATKSSKAKGGKRGKA
ncbi:kinase that interacts with cdc31p, partial [Coemansia furcata]